MAKEREITPNYRRELQRGETYQQFVTTQLRRLGITITNCDTQQDQCNIGENREGVEIKFDGKFHNSGNLYLEYAEKSNPDIERWTNSGILRADNSILICIGNYDIIYIFKKAVLRQMYLDVLDYKLNYIKVEQPTSRGILLPVSEIPIYEVGTIRI